MFSVLKANLNRLFKNIYFIAGCILAAVITWYFVTNAEAILGPHYREKAGAMQLISIGVIMFVSIFAPIFQSTEYTNGVIRNKIVMGKKQSEIYAAHYITMLVVAAAIIISWLIGGIIAGVSVNAWLITYTVKLFFSMIAYSSFMTFIGMRFKKVITSATLGILAVQGGFSSIIIIFMVASRNFGTFMGTVFSYIGNALAIGRWFSNSQLCDPGCNLNIVLTLVVSLVMAVIYYVIGSYRIDKRDLA